MNRLYSVLLVCLLSLTGCDHPENTMPSASDADDLYLHYATNGESYYTDIKVEAGELIHTYFIDHENRCAQWFRNEPCWTQADLRTTKRSLDHQELAALQTLISDSAVLKMNTETFGEQDPHQRAYAEILEVRMGGEACQLTYRSNPEAAGKPAEFTTLEQALQSLLTKGATL